MPSPVLPLARPGGAAVAVHVPHDVCGAYADEAEFVSHPPAKPPGAECVAQLEARGAHISADAAMSESPSPAPWSEPMRSLALPPPAGPRPSLRAPLDSSAPLAPLEGVGVSASEAALARLAGALSCELWYAAPAGLRSFGGMLTAVDPRRQAAAGAPSALTETATALPSTNLILQLSALEAALQTTASSGSSGGVGFVAASAAGAAADDGLYTVQSTLTRLLSLEVRARESWLRQRREHTSRDGDGGGAAGGGGSSRSRGHGGASVAPLPSDRFSVGFGGLSKSPHSSMLRGLAALATQAEDDGGRSSSSRISGIDSSAEATLSAEMRDRCGKSQGSGRSIASCRSSSASFTSLLIAPPLRGRSMSGDGIPWRQLPGSGRSRNPASPVPPHSSRSGDAALPFLVVVPGSGRSVRAGSGPFGADLAIDCSTLTCGSTVHVNLITGTPLVMRELIISVLPGGRYSSCSRSAEDGDGRGGLIALVPPSSPQPSHLPAASVLPLLSPTSAGTSRMLPFVEEAEAPVGVLSALHSPASAISSGDDFGGGNASRTDLPSLSSALARRDPTSQQHNSNCVSAAAALLASPNTPLLSQRASQLPSIMSLAPCCSSITQEPPPSSATTVPAAMHSAASGEEASHLPPLLLPRLSLSNVSALASAPSPLLLPRSTRTTAMPLRQGVPALILPRSTRKGAPGVLLQGGSAGSSVRSVGLLSSGGRAISGHRLFGAASAATTSSSRRQGQSQRLPSASGSSPGCGGPLGSPQGGAPATPTLDFFYDGTAAGFASAAGDVAAATEDGPPVSPLRPPMPPDCIASFEALQTADADKQHLSARLLALPTALLEETFAIRPGSPFGWVGPSGVVAIDGGVDGKERSVESSQPGHGVEESVELGAESIGSVGHLLPSPTPLPSEELPFDVDTAAAAVAAATATMAEALPFVGWTGIDAQPVLVQRFSRRIRALIAPPLQAHAAGAPSALVSPRATATDAQQTISPRTILAPPATAASSPPAVSAVGAFETGRSGIAAIAYTSYLEARQSSPLYADSSLHVSTITALMSCLLRGGDGADFRGRQRGSPPDGLLRGPAVRADAPGFDTLLWARPSLPAAETKDAAASRAHGGRRAIAPPHFRAPLHLLSPRAPSSTGASFTGSCCKDDTAARDLAPISPAAATHFIRVDDEGDRSAAHWESLDDHPIYVLQCHLAHPSNTALVNTALWDACASRGRPFVRLLRLLSADFFQPSCYELLHRIGSGAFGTVIAAVASVESVAATALQTFEMLRPSDRGIDASQQRRSEESEEDVCANASEPFSTSPAAATSSMPIAASVRAAGDDDSSPDALDDGEPLTAIKVVPFYEDATERCVLTGFYAEVSLLEDITLAYHHLQPPAAEVLPLEGGGRCHPLQRYRGCPVTRLLDYGVAPGALWAVMEHCTHSLKSWRVRYDGGALSPSIHPCSPRLATPPPHLALHLGSGTAPAPTALEPLGLPKHASAPRDAKEAPLQKRRRTRLHLAIFACICLRLAQLHDWGLTHYDIKADNILLRPGFDAAALVVANSLCRGGAAPSEVASVDDGTRPASGSRLGSDDGGGATTPAAPPLACLLLPFVCLGDLGESARCPTGGAAAHAQPLHGRGTECIMAPELLGRPRCEPPPEADSGDSSSSGTTAAAAAPAGGGAAACDVWSLGCILYELVTGATLFGRDGPGGTEALAAAIASADGDEAAPPHSQLADLRLHTGPESFPVIMRLLRGTVAWDPRSRFSMGELIDAVAASLHD